MAETETELEEQLVSVGKKLINPSSDATEILPLLDEAESLLLKVEQSPSESMTAALRPAMNALVAKELMGHLDTDVKVALASCISEITRITAPEAPYDDELMKDIFKLIVEAFKGLDDMSCPSYYRRVSILETVAKVRSCVVMLDLECDVLILEMFRYFLAAIRDSHPENVFSLMETIMTLVLEESEDISSELVSCLLTSVKNDNKDILPIAFTLGEKVIRNCSAKLEPYLPEVIQSLGTSLSDYSGVVASVCQDKSTMHEKNNNIASSECMDDDSKLSERTISEDLPQGRGGMELEVGCSEEVNTVTAKSTENLLSNGTIHTSNENSLPSEKEPVETPSKGNEHSSEAAEDPSMKKSGSTLLLNDERKTKPQPQVGSNSKNISVDTPVTVRPKRGRPPGKTSAKKGLNAAADVSAKSSVPKKDSVAQQDKDEGVPSKSTAANKQASSTSDSEEKPLNHLSKKVRTKRIQEGEAKLANVASKFKEVTSETEASSPKKAGKKKGEDDSESLKKPQSQRGRPRKGSVTFEKDPEGEETLKEIASSPKATTKTNKYESHSKENLKSESRRKRARSMEETPKLPQGAKHLDEKLVGSSIKVWWPDDKKFYRGVVGSYSPNKKKHKVLYADGDIEVLDLKKERWELVKEDKMSSEDGDVLTPEPSEMVSKKAKVDLSSAKKQAKVTEIKSGISAGKPKGVVSGSSGKSGGDGSKFAGGRKGVGSGEKLKEKTRNMSHEDSGEKSKLETPDVDAMGKSGKAKDETPRTKDMSLGDDLRKGKDAVAKANHKSDDGTHEMEAGKKTKGGNTPKSSSKSTANGDSVKGMVSSKIEETKHSDVNSNSGSVKASASSKKRRRTVKS